MLRDLHLYVPLFLVILGFVVVFFVGVAFLKFKRKKYFKRLGGLLMVIGGFMSALLTFLIVWLPTPTEFLIMELSLFHSSPELFRSVTLISNDAETTDLFNMENFEIEKPYQIKSVISALHTAELFSPSNRDAIWSLKLTFNTKKRHISMDVDYCGGVLSENGTILNIDNNMGTYRCDNMGSTLRNILRDHANKRTAGIALKLRAPFFGAPG
jgi:hypothetical protein